jgi:hypothetical protein
MHESAVGRAVGPVKQKSSRRLIRSRLSKEKDSQNNILNASRTLRTCVATGGAVRFPGTRVAELKIA